MNERRDKWDELFAKIGDTIEAWREVHPEATLTEIEEAVGIGMATMGRQLVEDLAQEGRTADLTKLAREERPRCPECGEAVIANGKGRRQLITEYEQRIELERSKAYCPHCQVSFFPSG